MVEACVRVQRSVMDVDGRKVQPSGVPLRKLERHGVNAAPPGPTPEGGSLQLEDREPVIAVFRYLIPNVTWNPKTLVESVQVVQVRDERGFKAPDVMNPEFGSLERDRQTQ